MLGLQSTREKVSALLNGLQDIEDGVVRGEQLFDGKCYAVAYVDLADDVVGRADNLNDFQEQILGNDFFETPGDLRWNKYLYIVAGPKSINQDGFEKAKATIESDKEYARKRVVSEAELETLLGAVWHSAVNDADSNFDIVAEWEKCLSAVGLEELLDRPTRKDMLQRIGTGSAMRLPVGDKTLTVTPSDSLLAQQHLASISIDKFRPVHDGKSYSFGRVTLVVGANGTGKTSLLEAIEYFYCGHNRRQGNATTPVISGVLNGLSERLLASSDAARIRARCLSWYNREERTGKAIIGAFTRYNFLDTDAAFRISTELDPSELPNDLSRLLVGSDASTIWTYLEKIAPEVDTAHERSIMRTEDIRQKLEAAQCELLATQSRPSNGKALTDAFRFALEGLNWKGSRYNTPLAIEEEAQGLSEALGYLQSVLAAGSTAMTPKSISSRAGKLNFAVEEARPLQEEREAHAVEMNRLAEEAKVCEEASETLDDWLTYVNSGFATAYARGRKAREAFEEARKSLGAFANFDIPEVPDRYKALSLDLALQSARLDVQFSQDQVFSLSKLTDSFGRAASDRAQAAHQLRGAVKATFDAGHPEDDCPICRSKYLPQELAALVENITGRLEEDGELTEVVSQLAEAEEKLDTIQSDVGFLEELQSMAAVFEMAPNTLCVEVPARMVVLKAEFTRTEHELAVTRAEWKKFSSSELTTAECDQIREFIPSLLPLPQYEFDSSAIDEARMKNRQLAATARDKHSHFRKLINDLELRISTINSVVADGGWTTRAQQETGMKSLIIMQEEIGSIQSRINALEGFMEIDDDTLLSELSGKIIGAVRTHAEAIEAAREENQFSSKTSSLKAMVESLKEELGQSSKQVKHYGIAKSALERLRGELSLERATQESLDAIRSEINEIFSRIHSPHEYEYVGQGDTLLETSTAGERRTLEQISTGQRAAFALSIFLSMNRNATKAPPVLLIDDPIAHIDDLNALSFLDYLRDLAVNSNRQVFFATADTRIASLFTRKFSFLGDSFQSIQLER